MFQSFSKYHNNASLVQKPQDGKFESTERWVISEKMFLAKNPLAVEFLASVHRLRSLLIALD